MGEQFETIHVFGFLEAELCGLMRHILWAWLSLSLATSEQLNLSCSFLQFGVGSESLNPNPCLGPSGCLSREAVRGSATAQVFDIRRTHFILKFLGTPGAVSYETGTKTSLHSQQLQLMANLIYTRCSVLWSHMVPAAPSRTLSDTASCFLQPSA